jgi:hypothetical protein
MIPVPSIAGFIPKPHELPSQMTTAGLPRFAWRR